MSATVSIIIPVYNAAFCLRETIDSVVGQTYRALEIICVDDGSTDGSAAILHEYAQRDERVRVIEQANAGAAAARNAGLDAATGEYLMMLDADDLYAPNMIEKMYGRARMGGCDIVICRSVEFDHETGSVVNSTGSARIDQVPLKECFTWEDMGGYVFTAFLGWPWDKFYRRSFVEQNRLRFPLLKNSEDLYFVFLSLVRAQGISFIEEPLIRHRLARAGSVSNSRVQDPYAFYEGICLLKTTLKEGPSYEKLEWGFLNWAMDYTLWNIESLPLGEQRAGLVRALVSGRLSELEVCTHGMHYYALCPDFALRYNRLKEEIGLRDGSVAHAEVHPSLGYAVKFFSEAQWGGFRKAFGSLKDWLIRRSGKISDELPYSENRGKALLPERPLREEMNSDER